MNNWESTTLGQLVEQSDGVIQTGPFGSQLHMSDYSAVGTPVVMPTNIRDLRVDIAGIARVSEAHVKRLARHKLQPGDIVFSRRGDVDKCALITNKEAGWLCGTGCLLVRIGGATLDSRFLAYSLSQPRTSTWIRQRAVGATMPNLNTGILRQVPVELPTLKIQKNIAATLGALDDQVQSSKRTIIQSSSLLDLYSQAWSYSLGRVSLRNIASRTHASVTPTKLLQSLADHYSLPAFDTGQMPDRVAPEAIRSNKTLLERESVLVSRLNPRIDRTWWVEPDPDVPSLASTEFACLTASSDADLAAVWLAVRNPLFLDELRHRVTGTSGSHQRVRPDDLMSIEVPDFRLLSDAQKTAVLDLLHMSVRLRRRNQKLAELRDTLLPALMSGRLSVSEADERIAKQTPLKNEEASHA